jgi:O-antigen/teichoic acid export membrane protein
MGIDALQRQGIIGFFSIITLTGISFLSTMYFAHTLGALVLGAYSVFLSYYWILNLLGDSGLGGAAV